MVPKFRLGRRARRRCIALLLVTTLWLTISFAIAYRMTHRTREAFDEPAPTVAWGKLTGYRIATSDGESLGAWYHEGNPDAPSVLLLHGNRGSRSNVLRRASILAERGGCTVLLVSLRAHGDSTGTFNDFGYSARKDVVAAVEFLREHRPKKPVIVLGVSLGGAASIFAAGELRDKVQGYIIESPYRDLKTAVWNRTSVNLPAGINAFAYLGLRIASMVVLPNSDAVSPIDSIAEIPENVPVLILSGTNDRLARPEEARELYERVKSHARIEFIPNGEHHNLLEIDPDRYSRLILDFCASRKPSAMP